MKKSVKITDQASRINGENLTEKERSAIFDFIRNKKTNRTKKQIKRDKLLSYHARLLSGLHNESTPAKK